MIKSILDNDMYKFTMQEAVHALFPNEYVEYQLHIRDKNWQISEGTDFVYKLRKAIDNMANLGLTTEEANYMDHNGFNIDYVNWLYYCFKFNPNQVNVSVSKDNKLHLTIRGLWQDTILWEVPLMAIISELANTPVDYGTLTHYALERKQYLERFKVVEMGTRRRHSFDAQKVFLSNAGSSILGTSNLYFAKKYNLKPYGTQAHEWFMFHGAKYGPRSAATLAIDNWLKIHGHKRGVILTDTYTTDAFLQEFESYWDKFDGVRQDSGDPIEYINKMGAFYKGRGSQTITFSNGISSRAEMDRIASHCKDANFTPVFGIGTWLSNYVPLSTKPMNMVIKLTGVRSSTGEWLQALKLSDDTGKQSPWVTDETVKAYKELLRI